MKLANNHPFKVAAGTAALAFALLANTATAATVLIDEDFTSPGVGNGYRLDGTTTTEFPEWDFSASTNTFNIRNNSAGAPADAGNVLQFEWTGSNATYDTGHNWAVADQYSLTFNSSEQSWNAVRDRFLRIQIFETGTSNLLWEQTVEPSEYDAGESDFTAGETFAFNFSGSDFTGGTPGSGITFAVGQLPDGLAPGGSDPLRGIYVDNINLTLIPEPASAALLGLGGFALIFRRRK